MAPMPGSVTIALDALTLRPLSHVDHRVVRYVKVVVPPGPDACDQLVQWLERVETWPSDNLELCLVEDDHGRCALDAHPGRCARAIAGFLARLSPDVQLRRQSYAYPWSVKPGTLIALRTEKAMESVFLRSKKTCSGTIRGPRSVTFVTVHVASKVGWSEISAEEVKRDTESAGKWPYLDTDCVSYECAVSATRQPRDAKMDEEAEEQYMRRLDEHEHECDQIERGGA